MYRKTALALLPVEEEFRKSFMKTAPDYKFVWENPSDEDWENADIIFGNPSNEEIKKCPNLRWLQLGSAGADSYCVPGVLDESIQLTNATGCYGHAISEYMLGATLTILKKFHTYRDYQSQHCWKDAGVVKSISSCRVLVVGMGDIGSSYAKRMHALGAKVTGITRTPREEVPEYAEKMALLADLDALLPEYDIVALSLPNSPQTVGLMNAERLHRMKKGAVLINVGRGSAVCSDALCDVMEEGRLSGAVLDVTDPEPLPAGHRLWDCENVVITPHVSGGYHHMRETYENIMELCLSNLEAYLAGRPLTHCVNRTTGYMKK